MSHIIDFFNANKNNKNIVNEANEYLINDLLSKNLFGHNKIKTVDGVDMETALGSNIYPGMIYTFLYKAKKSVEDGDNINLGDNAPILFCTGYKHVNKIINGQIIPQLVIQGINLNFLKPVEKLAVLEFIVNSYRSFYESDVYNAMLNNSIALNTDLITNLIFNSKEFLKLIQQNTGINLLNCFRSYIISNVNNIRLIEYNLWQYIPFCSIVRSIKNLSLEQQAKLISYMNQ